jgi:tryptophanyl-tRNA synthetase
MRPTGRLHIGHYFGALQNWVRLQKDPQYECFFFIADWHALTTDYADTSAIAQNSIEIAVDWLAAGLDPEKSTIFVQSAVPEHAELHLLLSMITSLGWLERVPTYKELLENIKDKDLHTYGFLGYPVLQTADIVMYGEPAMDLLVPVGEDQESHVELGREIVHRFNLLYGLEQNEKLREPEFATRCGQIIHHLGISGFPLSVSDFPLTDEKWGQFKSKLRARILEIGVDNAIERLGTALAAGVVMSREVLRGPAALLTETPRVPGTDGRKMSKSYNNFISLSESDESIRTKVRAMVTDPARKRRQDPGNPEVCPVFDWHRLFPEEQTAEKRARIERVNLECRTASIGCVECKGLMADALIEWIAPVRARREQYAANPGEVLELLDRGSGKARWVAKNTMSRVRESVFGWEKLRASLAPSRETAGSREMTGAPDAASDVTGAGSTWSPGN